MKIEFPVYSIVPLATKKKKNGRSPIVLRVTFKGKRKYYSTKHSAFHYEWDNSKYFRGRNSIEKNHELKQIASIAQKVITTIKDQGKPFSFELFDRHFSGDSNPKFKVFIENHIESLKTMGRIGYATTFKDTLSQLKKYKDDNFHLKDMDVPFLEGFKKHYLEKGNKERSLNVHLINIRTLLNLAIRLQLISKETYPFREFKIVKCKEKRKIALPESDLKMLKCLKPIPQSEEWLAVNYFFVSYYLRGINLVDLLKLKWSENIVAGRLIYIRSKTGEDVSVKLRPEIMNILNSFKTNSDYIFPVYDETISIETKKARLQNLRKLINKKLKGISSDLSLQIGNRITYYSARHSYAMTLKRSGASNEVIKEGLVHRDQSTTDVYLDSFENEVVDNADDYLYTSKDEKSLDTTAIPAPSEDQLKIIANQLRGITIEDLINFKYSKEHSIISTS